MRKLRPIAIAAFCSIGFGAFAADYPQLFAPPPLDPVDKPTELGSGWYLRGDATWGQTKLPLLNADRSFTTPSKQTNSYAFGLGAGYKFNNWFRADLTFDVSTFQSRNVSTRTLNDGVSPIICPNGLMPIASGGILQGYLWDPVAGTCSQNQSTNQRTMTLLLNGYVDLGTWSSVTPYIGAGAGVARVQTDSTVKFVNNANGAAYAPTSWSVTAGTPVGFVDQFAQIVQPQPVIPNTASAVSLSSAPNWNQASHSIKYNFAWALMAGVAIDVAPHAKLDVGYRYMNASDRNMKVTSQEVRVGFRYTPD